MIDTDKYEGHTPAPWMMGEYKGRPSIHAGNETFVRSIARGLNPSQTADHALLLDAPLLLAEVIRLREVAYRKDMQVGERDREVKRLRDKVRLLERAEATWYSMVADELDGDYPND